MFRKVVLYKTRLKIPAFMIVSLTIQCADDLEGLAGDFCYEKIMRFGHFYCEILEFQVSFYFILFFYL